MTPKLPPGWKYYELETLVEFNPKNLNKDDSEALFAPMKLIPTKYLDKMEFETKLWKDIKSGFTHFQEGDVVVAKITPCFENAKSAIVEHNRQSFGAGTTEIFVLRPKEEKVLAKYLLAFFKTHHFLQKCTQNMRGAVGQKRVPKEYLLKFPVPLPQLEEQKRIVARLDQLLARVDNCRAHLDRAAAAIKRFRQSVLNAAVTGALNQSNFDKWQLFSLEQIGTLARGKSKHRPRNEPKLYGGPYPFIQTGDIANSGGRITSHKQTYSEEGLKQSKLFPAGTLCITIAANIADTAILTYPACFPDSVVGFIADNKVALNRFIQFAIDANKTLLDELATATAQKNINLSTFQKFKFRAPLVEEQVEIVMKAETLLNKADEIESKLTAARERVDNLTASILAKAFRGEILVEGRHQKFI